MNNVDDDGYFVGSSTFQLYLVKFSRCLDGTGTNGSGMIDLCGVYPAVSYCQLCMNLDRLP